MSKSRCVFVARHAWADERDAEKWPDDSLRALTDEGKSRYARVVQALSRRGFAPALLATSPFTRCRETADIIAAATSGSPQIKSLSALSPGSDLKALFLWLAERSDEQICLVGHAPDVSVITAALIGDPAANLRFAKGAVAAVRFYGELDPGVGELNWLVTAKVLGL